MLDAVVFMAMLLVLLIAWVLDVCKILLDLDSLCSKTLLDVGVKQELRWDILSDINYILKKYKLSESISIERAIQSRMVYNTDFKSVESINEQDRQYEKILKSLLDAIQVIDYRDIKTLDVIKSNIKTLKMLDLAVLENRREYNYTVQRYNRYIQNILTGFIANKFKFKLKEYLYINEKRINLYR